MSLKDALIKAGLKSSKMENERQFKPKKSMVKSEQHQQRRNFCEVCETTQPDVEKFKHRMPTVDAEWICSNCADKNQIHDKFRVTEQSEFSTSNRYRRFYGPTLKLEKNFNKPNSEHAHKAPKPRWGGQNGDRRNIKVNHHSENRQGNRAPKKKY